MSRASPAHYTERRTSFSLILAGLAGGVMLVSILAALLGFGGPRTVSTSVGVNVAVPAAAPAQPQRQWTARIAWKASDGADEAIKNCKDRECLYRVLQQRSAPAETVDFVHDMQSITSDSELG